MSSPHAWNNADLLPSVLQHGSFKDLLDWSEVCPQWITVIRKLLTGGKYSDELSYFCQFSTSAPFGKNATWKNRYDYQRSTRQIMKILSPTVEFLHIDYEEPNTNST